MLLKVAAVLLVVVGETFAVFAETLAPRFATQTNYVSTFATMFVIMTIGGAMLIAGYMLGYLYLKNIWIVVALSIATLVVAEPLIAWLAFHQMPTTGSTIALILGLAAIPCALLL